MLRAWLWTGWWKKDEGSVKFCWGTSTLEWSMMEKPGGETLVPEHFWLKKMIIFLVVSSDLWVFCWEAMWWWSCARNGYLRPQCAATSRRASHLSWESFLELESKWPTVQWNRLCDRCHLCCRRHSRSAIFFHWMRTVIHTFDFLWQRENLRKLSSGCCEIRANMKM